MKHRSATIYYPVTLSLSVLLLGGSAAAVATTSNAEAISRAQSRAERIARKEIAKARAALDRKNLPAAITHAEAAVALQPAAMGYRMTLGQSYLRAGRFASARDAFGDALSLDPANGKAALQFALMQIGTGDWAGARETLDAHAATIPVSDRGLGMALAGDPVAAVALLDPAARAAGADARIRQNFALSLALAGRWRDAQSVVEFDLAPVDAARRLLQWSTFARPTSASDQIAALLGVVPVVDAGQPRALALSDDRATRVAVAGGASVDLPESGNASQTVDEQRVAVAVSDVQPVVGPTIGAVVFGQRKEVVQPLPVTLASRHATIQPVVAIHRQYGTAKGNYYVQLGAYDTPAIARDAWIRAEQRFAALSKHVPQGMGVATRGANFYRLSIGAFAKNEALALCRTYRAKGGNCFVRVGAGDQVAVWVNRGNLASR